MADERLRAEGLDLGYDGRRHVQVVRDLDVAIPDGSFTVVVGPNGCGKSTLLRGLARMLAPRAGTVLLDGLPLRSLPAKQAARRLGLLPQGPTAPDGITAADLVGRGRYPHQGLFRQWSPEDERAVAEAMAATGVADLADAYVAELSGGQRQRVWLAMALAQQTPILLLDEPTTFLDVAHQVDVLDLCADLRERHGRTLVLVLHDLNLACRYASHLIAMRDGRIAAAGPPARIVTERLVEDVFGLRCRVVADPETGTPLVVPAGRRPRQADDGRNSGPAARGCGRVRVVEVRPFPGAHQPDRTRTVDAGGVALAVHEWGDATAPPLLLAHGGSDFARTFDVFAPLLARGGWRVVAWDQRGHGDSARADLYSLSADVRDSLAVARDLGVAPVPFVAHSKGSMVLLELAACRPDLLNAFVSLDGLPPQGDIVPDISESDRGRLRRGDVARWLDKGRHPHASRRPGTLRELAERRKQVNPRLSIDWLERLVSVGATESADGWRWKLDPSMQGGGFGAWRPDWLAPALAGLRVPTLGVIGLEPEPMGWGTRPRHVRDIMPPGSRLVALEGVGHFVHVERPKEMAELVLGFLDEAGAKP